MFDSALFYCKHRQFREQTDNILHSPHITKLVETLGRYSEQPDVRDVLNFVNSKLKMQHNR